ncbi:hypothetical protein Tco_0343533 [Tanacetum coccineum]
MNARGDCSKAKDLDDLRVRVSSDGWVEGCVIEFHLGFLYFANGWSATLIMVYRDIVVILIVVILHVKHATSARLMDGLEARTYLFYFQGFGPGFEVGFVCLERLASFGERLQKQAARPLETGGEGGLQSYAWVVFVLWRLLFGGIRKSQKRLRARSFLVFLEFIEALKTLKRLLTSEDEG